MKIQPPRPHRPFGSSAKTGPSQAPGAERAATSPRGGTALDRFWASLPDSVQQKISKVLDPFQENVLPWLTLDFEQLRRRATDAPPADAIVRAVDQELGEVDEARRATTWRALDEAGVVYPSFADETAAGGKVRTNYALVAEDAKAVVLSLDNANWRDPSYEGISKAERGFAQDVVEYAKEKGLPVLVLAHVPPNHRGRHSSYSDRVQFGREWLTSLRDEVYANVLFVFGHLHPSQGTRLDPADPDVDLDQGRDGKADVDAVILGGQKMGSFSKITLHEGGRSIEDFQVEGASARRVREIVLDTAGRPLADAAALGAPTGVFYGSSDLQAAGTVDGYFQALAADAKSESDRGRAVYYLLGGDVTVPHQHFPVHLPQHEHLLWSPGNHCYTDHESLDEVVRFLQPADGPVKFLVDYEKP